MQILLPLGDFQYRPEVKQNPEGTRKANCFPNQLYKQKVVGWNQNGFTSVPSIRNIPTVPLQQ